MTQTKLFDSAPEFFPKEDEYILHTHYFCSGPRHKSGYGKDGKWHEGGETITHSHPGGSIPHTHPHTGPSNYGYCHKFTKRPKGEQDHEVIPRTEEENTFELVITDSALIGAPGKLVPIGDMPIENILSPAADRMVNTFGMKCVVRDERKKVRRA